MSISFKNLMVQLKRDVQQLLKSDKRQKLSYQEASILIHKYTGESPIYIGKKIKKSTGKEQLTWDELLQYFEEELTLQDKTNKYEQLNPSATEITQQYYSYFNKLEQFVKKKETNLVQKIQPIDIDMYENIFLVILEKEIYIYSKDQQEIVSIFEFKYGKQPINIKSIIKQKQRKNLKTEQKDYDSIEQRQTILPLRNTNSKSFYNSNMMASGVKNSVRDSSKGSDKSREKSYLRRYITESSDNKKKNKSSVVKIRNDDTKKIFQLFQQSKLESSIEISHAFVEARSTFQKFVSLDKKMIQKQQQKPLQNLSCVKFPRNYTSQLHNLRKANRQLKLVSLQQKKLISSSLHQSPLKTPANEDNHTILSNYYKQKKEESLKANVLQNKKLQISSFATIPNYILVSFYNREIRLYRFRRSVSNMKEEMVFRRYFQFVATFVFLYWSASRKGYNMGVCLNKGNTSLIKIFELDRDLKIFEEVFQYEIGCCALFQQALPLGITFFSELGNFGLLELNRPQIKHFQKVTIDITLYTEQKQKVSITQVKGYPNSTVFFIGCNKGRLYIFSRISKKIAYKSKSQNSNLLDFALINQNQLLAMFRNGCLAIYSTKTLEVNFLYQTYRNLVRETKLLVCGDQFHVFTTRNIETFKLVENLDRKFQQTKPLKIMKSRNKMLKKRQLKSTSFIQKRTTTNQNQAIFRVIQRATYFALLSQSGQILYYTSKNEYLGSYHFLNINSIVNIECNQSFEFTCALFESNKIEVVNIYSQIVLFEVIGGNSSKKEEELFQWIYFLRKDDDLREFFLIVVTKKWNMRHYNQRGELKQVIDIGKSLDNLQINAFVFLQGQILTGSAKGSIHVFQKKIYSVKIIIQACDSQIVEMKIIKQTKSISNICLLNKDNQILLVNHKTKQVKILFRLPESTIVEEISFNRFYFLYKLDDKVTFYKICENKKKEFQVHYGDICFVFDKQVFKIQDEKGLIYLFDDDKNDFQHISL